MGKWITLEGLGGSGKSTQINLLCGWLNNNNIDFVMTKEPGGTDLGLKLRAVLKEKQDPPIELISELLLFEVDRHETVKKVVEPNVNLGKFVVSDRGIDGSIAYQGFGRGMDLELINTLTMVATENKEPHLTIFIDVDPFEAKRRVFARDKKETDQFDLEDIKFQERVREGFLFMAKKNPDRIKVVDGTKIAEEVHQLIVKIVQTVLL